MHSAAKNATQRRAAKALFAVAHPAVAHPKVRLISGLIFRFGIASPFFKSCC